MGIATAAFTTHLPLLCFVALPGKTSAQERSGAAEDKIMKEQRDNNWTSSLDAELEVKEVISK